MARHIKKNKKRRSKAWVTLLIFSLIAFTLGYLRSAGMLNF